MGFTTRNDVLTEAFTNGKMQSFPFTKSTGAAVTAGRLYSFWRLSGGTLGTGADPATTPGTAYSSDFASQTAGAIWFPDVSPDTRHLYSITAFPNNSVNLIVYDRLVGVSGISLATTGNKTVNSTALTRYTGTEAYDNEVWLEVTTATATTAPVVSLASYTSSDGSNALTGGTVTFPAAATAADFIVQVPLNATEMGVRSVETLNVGTAGSAGIVNVLIIKRLATIPLVTQHPNEINFLDRLPALPRIYDNATIGLALEGNSASAATVAGVITTVYG